MVKKEHKCHHLAKIVTGRVNNSRVSRKKWRNTGQQWSRLFMKCQMYCCWHVLTWTAEFVQIIASLKLHKTAAFQLCKSGWNDTDWYDNDDNVITRQTDMMEFVNRITLSHRCLFEKRADSGLLSVCQVKTIIIGIKIQNYYRYVKWKTIIGIKT